MLSKIVKLAVWLLNRSSISIIDRLVLTNAILDKLATIQSDDIIKLDENGTLLLNGRPLDYEQARLLRESARAVLNSTARSVVRKQVEYLAVTIGIHKADKPEQMLFGKAAIWWGQQEDNLYKLLSGEYSSL